MGNGVIFFIASHVHALDLAGPLQVFYEANDYLNHLEGCQKPSRSCGYNHYEIIYASEEPAQQMSAGLGITGLVPFAQVHAGAGDIIFIPGFKVEEYNKTGHAAFYAWLRQANEAKAVICSICTGAFALAQAGLLNGVACTTHWKYITRLQQQFPQALVIQNRLYVTAGNIYTSAGITTGIDMALHIIEERHGAQFAWQLARELVVYMRRNGDTAQESIYLKHRHHINDHIHAVQDWMIHHLNQKITIEGLAALVYMSPRNLTRLFKTVTGITIGSYLEKIRTEKALQLLNTGEKIATITQECGFKSTTQLRNILKKHLHYLPKSIV